MKRFALIAAVLSLAACNSAAKQKAMEDSVTAVAAAAAAAAAETARVADSTRMADSIKMAATTKKAPAKAPATKSKM